MRQLLRFLPAVVAVLSYARHGYAAAPVAFYGPALICSAAADPV